MPPTQDPRILAVLLWATLAVVGAVLAVLVVALVRRARRASDAEAFRELRETNPYEVTGPIPTRSGGDPR